MELMVSRYLTALSSTTCPRSAACRWCDSSFGIRTSGQSRLILP